MTAITTLRSITLAISALVMRVAWMVGVASSLLATEKMLKSGRVEAGLSLVLKGALGDEVR